VAPAGPAGAPRLRLRVAVALGEERRFPAELANLPRPHDVEDEEAQEDGERDEAEDRAEISHELRQGGPSYLPGLLAVECGNIDCDQRPTVGRALQTEGSVECGDSVGEPDEPGSCHLGPSDPVIPDFDVEVPVLDFRGDHCAIGMGVLDDVAAGIVSLGALDDQLAFTAKQETANAGKVTVDFTNNSALEHDVVLTDSQNKILGQTAIFQGGSKSFTATLAPGTYTYYCSVPGHRQAGMQGTLTVK
jgi:plastocyanin